MTLAVGGAVVDALRILTFNLRRDVESDGVHQWSARRDLVAQVVHDHAPDILGTQEGLPHQLAELDARLPGYVRVGAPREAGEEACALYYDTRRFEEVASGTFWLSDAPDTPASATWGNRLPRVVTWATLRERASGREATLANTHLDHESEAARRRAAQLLAQRLPGAILMGDLNAAPGEPTHTFLLRAGWDDGGAREPTYHGFTGRAHARLDHVFAPPGHRVRTHRVVARVQDGVHASDHHAVYAEIVPRG